MKAITKTVNKPQPPAAKPQAARLVVVDDHPIVREGLLRIIGQADDLCVCGQAENIAAALDAIDKLKPDLVLVDIALGTRNGLELIKDIKARYPLLPMLVHSMFEETLYAPRCLRAGASGYIMKQESAPVLLKAIRRVLKGEVYLSETMTRQMLSQMAGARNVQPGSPAELLSDREFEVFELLGRGHRTKEIADMLHLSSKTIQTYREQIKNKLAISDAVSLVRRAVQWTEAQQGSPNWSPATPALPAPQGQPT